MARTASEFESCRHARLVSHCFRTPLPKAEAFFEHGIHKVEVPKQFVAARASTEFQASYCAGQPETMAQIGCRHRLACQGLKLSRQGVLDSSFPPRGGRAVFFADNFRGVPANNQPHSASVLADAAGFAVHFQISHCFNALATFVYTSSESTCSLQPPLHRMNF